MYTDAFNSSDCHITEMAKTCWMALCKGHYRNLELEYNDTLPKTVVVSAAHWQSMQIALHLEQRSAITVADVS